MIYNTYEYNRVNWIFRLLDQYQSLSYADLRPLMIRMADSRVLSSGNAMNGEPTPIAPLNNSTDTFMLLRDCIFAAVNANPTPQRLALLQQLASYDGRWIGGDLENEVNSLNVLDNWMLANSWISAMIVNILGTALPPAFFTPRNVPWQGPIDLLSLLIRVICNTCGNPLYYSGWP
jgi:hypothetical protein